MELVERDCMREAEDELVDRLRDALAGGWTQWQDLQNKDSWKATLKKGACLVYEIRIVGGDGKPPSGLERKEGIIYIGKQVNAHRIKNFHNRVYLQKDAHSGAAKWSLHSVDFSLEVKFQFRYRQFSRRELVPAAECFRISMFKEIHGELPLLNGKEN